MTEKKQNGLIATLRHPDGEVYIERLSAARRRVRVQPNKRRPIAFRQCETTYPLELIERILALKGLCHLCDEIARDQDPSYVRRTFEIELFAYFDEAEFAGKRLLDFGCGSGGSTMVLARMFPQTEIVGVEMLRPLLGLAEARLRYYGFSNVTLRPSPSATELPEGIGQFDFVIMSAVFEHLLPSERRAIMPKLWSAIRPGGHLFINQTPYRFFPVERHTTRLPLLNYLPDRMVLSAARHFCGRIAGDESWESLLRRGIRGGTEREVIRLLRQDATGEPVLLRPSRLGYRDRIDMWYARLGGEKHQALKRALKALVRLVKLLSRATMVPEIALAIRKDSWSGPKPQISQITQIIGKFPSLRKSA